MNAKPRAAHARWTSTTVLRLVACVLIVGGVAIRLNNALHFPVLGSYDAFSHFTYIWYLAETGSVPVASQGWSYFHPPLYYALMASVWRLLDGSDPLLRLHLGTALVAAAGSLHAFVAWALLRRRFPHDTAAPLAGAAFVLCVPVMAYSAGFLGNEGLGAVLSSLALLALVRTLEQPRAGRAAVLGVCLGLAMLTKFSAVTVLSASLVTLAACAMRRPAPGRAGALVVTAAVALAVCGPWYARNVALYGDPFALARDRTFMTAYVEGNQPRAARGWADYLTFDPWIFRRPVWPRGATPHEDASEHGLARSMRESVWTGLYANTWFDGFGGWVLPPVTASEASRRAGQALLILGLVPTLLVLTGAVTAAGRIRRRGWDDTTLALGAATLAMLALLVVGTREVPIAAAVKATYLTPVAVAFAYWFAVGLADLRERRASWFAPAALVCASAGMLSLAVFWQGLLFDPASIRSDLPRYDASRRNQVGVVLYAGGEREKARQVFAEVAASNYHLAVENLGLLAVEDGKLRDGLRLLRRAARLQRRQVDGGPIRGDELLRLSSAEYAHTIATVLDALGRPRRADAAWSRALRSDPGHAEALWCRTLARLGTRLDEAAGDPEARARALEEARTGLALVRELDPGWKHGYVLGATVEAAGGRCDAARELLDLYRALPWWSARRFPAEAGNGAALAASISRRRLVPPRRDELEPAAALARCGLVAP